MFSFLFPFSLFNQHVPVLVWQPCWSRVPIVCTASRLVPRKSMSLRRYAHENNAAASPRSPDRATNLPLTTASTNTPRTRLSFGIHRSPADTPSISSSIPFDWEAARSRAPPPYATPLKSRPRKSIGTGASPNARKAVVRKRGLLAKYVSTIYSVNGRLTNI